MGSFLIQKSLYNLPKISSVHSSFIHLLAQQRSNSWRPGSDSVILINWVKLFAYLFWWFISNIKRETDTDIIDCLQTLSKYLFKHSIDGYSLMKFAKFIKITQDFVFLTSLQFSHQVWLLIAICSNSWNSSKTYIFYVCWSLCAPTVWLLQFAYELSLTWHTLHHLV